MDAIGELEQVVSGAGAHFQQHGAVAVAAHFGDPRAEYHAAATGAGLYWPALRGTLEISGADRLSWLNNLLTNDVKQLVPGQGRYAFALNVKGRILFDINVLVLPDALWLDIDRRWLAAAAAHLERYHITEDVQLRDRTAELGRLAMVGSQAAELVAQLAPAGELPQLGSVRVRIAEADALLVSHDSAGVFGAELYVPAGRSAGAWQELLDRGAAAGMRPVGHEAIEMLRIEAGIPASVQDLDDTVLPAETGQLDRAVSFTKGCYLGQEVVERMRSREAVARQFVGLFTAELTKPPVPVLSGGTEVGRVTSACESGMLGRPIALAYVKMNLAEPGTAVQVAGCPAEVAALPFRRP